MPPIQHPFDLSRVSPEHHHREDYIGGLVATATMAPSGIPVVTGIRCRRRPNRKPCAGRLMVCRQDVPAKILWECPDCGDGGSVLGWRGAYWDFTEFASHDEDLADEMRQVELSYHAFDGLRRFVPSRRELQSVLYRGWVQTTRVVIEAPIDHLEIMAAWLSREVEVQQNGRRRRQLNHLAATFERAVACLEPFPAYELEPARRPRPPIKTRQVRNRKASSDTGPVIK